MVEPLTDAELDEIEDFWGDPSFRSPVVPRLIAEIRRLNAENEKCCGNYR